MTAYVEVAEIYGYRSFARRWWMIFVKSSDVGEFYEALETDSDLSVEDGLAFARGWCEDRSINVLKVIPHRN